MAIRLFLSVLLLLKFTSASAFFYSTISGRVLDQQNKPVELAVVTLLKSEDSTLVKGAVTSEEGKFSFEGFAGGKYLIVVSSPSFSKQTIGPIDIQESQTTQLPDIILVSSAQLNEVAIVAAQPLFTQKPGMLVMNVENSPVRITGTAYDVVSKAPGVSTDQDGNFSLQGKGGVKIYIDNKPTYLSGDQLRAYLQGMPASEIIRVEIMTNPPAKYDAEGSSGIINIVTKKGSQQGLNGSVSAGFGYGLTDKEEAGINMNYGMPKSNIYLKYDFASPKRKEIKFVTRTVSYNGENSRYDQDVDMSFGIFSHHVRLGADFNPTKTVTWGIRTDGSLFDSKSILDSRNTVTQVDSGSNSILHQINTLNGNFNNASAGVYFKKEFDTLGTELSTSFDYVNYSNRSHETYDLHFIDDNGNATAPSAYQRVLKGTDIGIYVAQIDYTHPFEKKYKLEAGVKSSYVKTNNDLNFEIQDNSTGNWNNDSTRSNSFIYKEQINAAYTSLSADYGKWQLEAGLRAEQTISNGNSPTTGEIHKNDYIKFFPTIFASQKINDKQSMTYSLARRLNRPAYGELNPFIFYIDQYTYHLGNPFLQPEFSNNVEITHDYGDFLFTTLGFSRTSGGMADATHQIDSTGILNQSTININTIDYAYGNLNFSMPVTKWWTSEINVAFNYNHYKTDLNGSALDRENTAFDFYTNQTFLIKGGWKFEASAWYQSSLVYTIFVIQPSGDVTFGLSKNFLKNKLRLTINASDAFYNNTQHVNVDFENQHLYARHAFDSRVVYVRLRYNFGNSKAARKSEFKNAADDLQKRAGK
jgi:iron complex outermembrane receptor protein